MRVNNYIIIIFGLVIWLFLTESCQADSGVVFTPNNIKTIWQDKQTICSEDARQYIYFGCDSVLKIVKSSSSGKEQTGEVCLYENLYAIKILDDIAYIANGKAGVSVVDIHDPYHPTVRSVFKTHNFARDLVVRKNIAYVVNYNSGIQLLDISDLDNIKEVDFTTTKAYSESIAIYNDYLYLANGKYGLGVFKILPSGLLSQISDFYFSGWLYDVCIQDGLAYISDHIHGLRILDISDPERPCQINMVNLPSKVFGLSIDKRCAYLLDENFFIHIIDIIEPSKSFLVKSYYLGELAKGILATNQHLYITDGKYGLTSIDVSDPKNPIKLKNYDIRLIKSEFNIHDNMLHFLDNKNVLKLLDIHDINHINQIGSIITNSWITGVFNHGDLLYVTAANEGLYVYEICQDKPPIKVCQFNTTGWMNDIVVDHNIAFVADYDFGLFVLNLEDFANPRKIAFLPVAKYSKKLIKYENYLFLLTDSEVIYIIDVNNVYDPQIKSRLIASQQILDCNYSNKRLIVWEKNNSVKLWDLSDINHPVQKASFFPDFLIHDLVFYQNYLFLVDEYGDVHTFEITSSENFCKIINLNISNETSEISLSKGYFFSKQQDGKIISFDLNNIPSLGFFSESDNADHYVTIKKSSALDAEDEIAIFDMERCIGKANVEYQDTIRIPFKVDMELNSEQSIKGAKLGNPIYYRIWDRDKNKKYYAQACYSKGQGIFTNQNLFVDSLFATGLTHFYTIPENGKSNLVIIKNIIGEGFDLSLGDELAVFDEDLCVGAKVFDGKYPVNLPVWLRSSLGREAYFPGAQVNHTMSFKLWKKNSQKEYGGIASYAVGKGIFGDLLTVVDLLTLISIDDFEYSVAKSINSKKTEDNAVPEIFALEQNYPNPFNSETRIRFQLPEATKVNLVIYNMLGQKVRTIVSEDKAAGNYDVVWNGRNDKGIQLSSGVYLLQMQVHEFFSKKKLLLLR